MPGECRIRDHQHARSNRCEKRIDEPRRHASSTSIFADNQRTELARLIRVLAQLDCARRPAPDFEAEKLLIGSIRWQRSPSWVEGSALGGLGHNIAIRYALDF